MNPKNSDFVSIVVPVYNVSLYVRECIESIQNQTHQNFECLLVDDGSTDDTITILEQLIKNDVRFQLIKQKNSGPAKARNKALKKVTGDYILFVDSDDKLEKNATEKLVSAANKHQADIVIGRTKRFNDEKTWNVSSHEKYKLNIEEYKIIAANAELFYAIGPAAKLFKRNLIKDVYFDETKKFAEDQLFVFQAYVSANQIYSINEVVYYYRVREKEPSLTQKYKDNPIENVSVFIELMSETRNFLKINQVKNQDQILKNYYNRLFEIELRVLFKNILLRNGREQKQFYESFFLFFKQNQQIIITCQNFYQYIVQEQLDFLFLVKKQGMKVLLDILELANNPKKVSSNQKNILNNLINVSKFQVKYQQISSFFRKLKAGR